MLGVWRIAIHCLIGALLFGAVIMFGIACVALPVGIVWDMVLWLVEGHYPQTDMTTNVMRSHFIWGAAFGGGLARFWLEQSREFGSNKWRELATSPIIDLLRLKVTTSADRTPEDGM